MHEVTDALVGRRGAVGALVHIDRAAMHLRYAALGNIATLRVRNGEVKRLPVRDGRIGARATRGYEEDFALEPGDLIATGTPPKRASPVIIELPQRRPISKKEEVSVTASIMRRIL